jgi:DNA-binding response OmpR family regulator
MQRPNIILLLLLCFLPISPALFAQNKAVLDTMVNRMMLLGELSQAGNFEQAQVEAEWYRAFLRRHKQPVSPKALGLISAIYKNNKDERSIGLLLREAEVDARQETNFDTKAALLSALVKEAQRWELKDMALNFQQMFGAAQDSLAARRRFLDNRKMRLQFDSLVAVREQEQAVQSNYVLLERERAYLLAGAVALVFFALLFANFRNTDQWRKLMEKKELEWELLQANLRKSAEERVVNQVVEAVEAEKTKTVSTTSHDPYTMYFGEKPEQIALVIEPNRQIALYMKSLLADRFQVETAATPAEALQMAHNLLPDIIVCDVVLNGKTGIDVSRQIKLSERTNHIPVLLLSDKFGNDGKLDALRAGADAWFTRPVLDDEFDASVQKLLDARKVKHENFKRFVHLYFTDAKIPIDDPFLAKTVQLIEQNLADPDYTAEDIARKMQLSKTHYFKKLKVLTGKEPVQLIRELRLEKAKVLLEKRAGNPQAISELVGFNNPGTFALAFKDYFGENTLLLYSLPPGGNRLLS